MSKIINLRRARKDRARDEKRNAGDANALKHAQTKAARLKRQAEAEITRLRLDGHQRDD